MTIGNVTQFASFLSSNGLTNLDPAFVQVVHCINEYSTACNCYKVEDKNKMYAICNKTYRYAACNIVPKYKNAILQHVQDGRITFLNDNGSLITIVSR